MSPQSPLPLLKYETKTLGNPSDPAVIVLVSTGVSGLNNAMIDRGLAQRGLYVILMNGRDTAGGSLEEAFDGDLPAGTDLVAEMSKAMAGDDFVAPYDWHDMADDVVNVLDQHEIDKAHVIGFSTGGTLAQVVMTRHPDRLRSCVMCCSAYEFDFEPFAGEGADELVQVMQSARPLKQGETTLQDWVQRQIDFFGLIRELEGQHDPRRAEMEECAADDFQNGWVDWTGMAKVRSALAFFMWHKKHEQRHKEALRSNKVPALVVHGERDPVVAFKNAELLAENTASASLKTHPYGHCLGPARSENELLDFIVGFMKRH